MSDVPRVRLKAFALWFALGHMTGVAVGGAIAAACLHAPARPQAEAELHAHKWGKYGPVQYGIGGPTQARLCDTCGEGEIKKVREQ